MQKRGLMNGVKSIMTVYNNNVYYKIKWALSSCLIIGVSKCIIKQTLFSYKYPQSKLFILPVRTVKPVKPQI